MAVRPLALRAVHEPAWRGLTSAWRFLSPFGAKNALIPSRAERRDEIEACEKSTVSIVRGAATLLSGLRGMSVVMAAKRLMDLARGVPLRGRSV
ncbi:MAG: hypothetical protein DIU79_03150 [Actinobacteria bacterium]|nr:MAG: hypothetical protein DIU79_03150 [Actinomycetota bacterium]